MTSKALSSSRPTYSCVRCADRKVKCDRQRPCGACVKHNVDCVFKSSQPPQKRHKRVKVQALTDRLERYESIFQELGIDPNKPLNLSSSSRCHKSAADHVAVQAQAVSFNASQQNWHDDDIEPVHQQPRFSFVENSLWTRVVQETHDAESLLEEPSGSSDLEASDHEFDFVLNRQPKSDIRSHHPSAKHIHQLWEVFVENVDPLTKVVHVPTLRPTVHRAASSIKSIPRNLEALMFAINAAAVMSLDDDECKSRFLENRTTLLSRYTSLTEAALSRAKFMGTTSLVILQALILHLISVRDIYEPRAIWTLTGVAVRIAQSMGLERDGVHLNLPPFETEMRRRIWWQLKWHDFRTAELCGLAKFRDLDMSEESTKWPANVNDDQLFPSMSSPVTESNKLGDSLFVAFKCELANFAAARITAFRRQGKSSSHWNLDISKSDHLDVENACTELEEVFETKYLRYCDPSQPLHFLTMLVIRYAMNVVRFLTHHPRRWASTEETPLSERQLVWEVSIKLLEQHNTIKSNPLLKNFAWHAAYFQHWHAFIHLLDTLRANPLKPDADKAWQLVGNIYDTTPDMALNMKKPIHIAVANLCLKAYSDREAALQNRDACLPPTPEFISRLRQRRELAKSRARAPNGRTKRTENIFRHNLVNAQAVGSCPDLPRLQQDTVPISPILVKSTEVNERDPFDLIKGLDCGQVSDLDMELDLVGAQYQNVEEHGTEAINWEQWDAWLADSNMMQSLSSVRD